MITKKMKTINKKKITIIHGESFSSSYKKFIEDKYDATFLTLRQAYDTRDKIDFLLFTGGADVSPSLYNEEVGQYTSINKKRDTAESDLFYEFEHIPKLGICRGSQFLTVMSGGKLIQHVDNHTQSHEIDVDNKLIYNPNFYFERDYSSYEITSTHHQMMYPFCLPKDKYELIGWSKYFRATTYLNGKNEEIDLPTKFLEPEIVYYNNSKSLCIQGHPEMEQCPNNTKNLIYKLIDKYLLNEKK